MPWTAYIDGGARGNPGPAATGIQLLDPDGRTVFAAGLCLGHKTSNEAEYAGLLTALDLLAAANAKDVLIRSDSELLVRQMRGQYRVKAANLRPLFEQAVTRIDGFDRHCFEHIPREQNRDADSLVNQALDAVTDVVPIDALSLLSCIRRPKVTVAPAGQLRPAGLTPDRSSTVRGQATADRKQPAGSQHGVAVTVIKPSRSGLCPARLRAGQVYLFADTVPAGLCVDACAAMIDAVLSLRLIMAEQNERIEPMTVTCQRPDCGAVFQLSVNG